MTAVFVAGLFVGWVSLAVGAGLVLGAVIRLADRADHRIPPKQPAGVRDPETQLLWDETGRITGQTWEAWL